MQQIQMYVKCDRYCYFIAINITGNITVSITFKTEMLAGKITNKINYYIMFT